MKYLHRTMFVLFTLGIFFGFSNDAWSRTRHHHHRHHKVKVITKIEKVNHYVYVTEKQTFPVINAAPMEYAYLNISKLLSDVSEPIVTVVGDDRYSNEYNPIDASLDNNEVQQHLLNIIGYMSLIIGLALITTIVGIEHVEKSALLRLYSRSAWTRTTEVVRRAYDQSKARTYYGWLQVGDLVGRLRTLIALRFREDLSSSEVAGRRLIQELLPKLPKKYVSRFDISS